MAHLNAKMLHRLATRPHEYARFVTTGRLPRGVHPQGPLVSLLRALSPRDLQRLRGMTVDARLGYAGSRRFHFAAQALQWIAPAEEVFDSFPAESWRDKRFNGPLYLEDLAACCTEFPDELFKRYPLLCRPVPPAAAPAPAL